MKHPKPGTVDDLYFGNILERENWNFEDVKLVIENTGMQFGDIHKETFATIAKKYIDRISVMSNFMHGKIDYYFAFGFWSNVLKHVININSIAMKSFILITKKLCQQLHTKHLKA